MTFAALGWQDMHYTWMAKAYEDMVSVIKVLTRLLHRRITLPKAIDIEEKATNPDCGQEKPRLEAADFFYQMESETQSPSFMCAWRSLKK